MNLFGFELTKKKPLQKKSIENITQASQDGEIEVSSAGAGYYGHTIDIEGIIKNEDELIKKYREVAGYPDADSAIEDIINEAITSEEDENAVDIKLDDLKVGENVKTKIKDSFDEIINLLEFNSRGHDIFRQWYIDGRKYYHIIIDSANVSKGIHKLIPIDSRKIRKIKNVIKKKNPNGVDIIDSIEEYFIYNDKGIQSSNAKGVKLSVDSVAYVPSGNADQNTGIMLSYLHKAIKPVNQLRMIEDAFVIYTISRAPQRRIFYIDVGNLPKFKAEQYVTDIMSKFRNKIVYDAKTGEVKDDKKHMSILEDFWMPRREGCFSLDTKIKLLDGRDVELGQLIVEFKLGKENWIYSVSDTGKVVPGLISWAGVTRTDTDVVEVLLDNGEKITCTPDHKFILRNGERIEAQHLQAGSSLMPLNTDEKSPNNGTSKYTTVQDNETEEWNYTHKMVAEFMQRPSEKTEVVHHIDFDRYNNNPDNLQIMDKITHFQYHSSVGRQNWTNGNIEEHKRKLSESGKEFFKSEEGLARRKEISEFNKNSKKVWDGFNNGRQKIKLMRAEDKINLSHEDYLAKWSPGLGDMSIAGNIRAKEQRILDNGLLSESEYNNKWYGLESRKIKYETHLKDFNLNSIVKELEKDFYPNIKNSEIIVCAKKLYPEINIKKFRRILSFNGYKSVSDFIIRNFDIVGKRRSYQAESFSNHKVISVTFLENKMDVGTLTIDEEHIHHDYHNFGLTAGVFVMNSKGTEITTLQGGDSLIGNDSMQYFQQKLFQSLNVPISRLQQNQGFSLGKSSEITRDEIKFNKFIIRLRRKFSVLFYDLLKVQLVSKGIMTLEEWEENKQFIKFDFRRDNFFSEFKQNEIISSRIVLLQQADAFEGKYYSRDWIKKNILMQEDDEIKELKQEMDSDAKEFPIQDPQEQGVQQ